MIYHHIFRNYQPLEACGSIASASINAASNMAIAGLNYKSQQETNAMNYKIHQEDNQFNAEEAQKNRDFQVEMQDKQNEYTSAAQQMQRLKEAGINPTQIDTGINAGTTAAPAGSQATAAGAPAITAPQIDSNLVGNSAGQFLDIMMKTETYESDVKRIQAESQQAQVQAAYASDLNKCTIDQANAMLQKALADYELTQQEIETSKSDKSLKDATTQKELANRNLIDASARNVKLNMYNTYATFIATWSNQYTSTADRALAIQQLQNTLQIEKTRLDNDVKKTLIEWKRQNSVVSYVYGSRHDSSFKTTSEVSDFVKKANGFTSEGTFDLTAGSKDLNIGALGSPVAAEVGLKISGTDLSETQSINNSGNESNYSNSFIEQNKELYSQLVDINCALEVMTHPDEYGQDLAKKALKRYNDLWEDFSKQEMLMKVVSEQIGKAINNLSN